MPKPSEMKEDAAKSYATQEYRKIVDCGIFVTVFLAQEFKIVLKFHLPKLGPNEKWKNWTLAQEHVHVSKVMLIPTPPPQGLRGKQTFPFGWQS